MAKTSQKQMKRETRHRRVRARVSGVESRPRLSVYKSNTRLIAQIIDDAAGKTLVASSSDKEKGKTPLERAKSMAHTLAGEAKKKGIEAVVFDRGGFNYTGTIAAFADAAREQGLKF